MDDTRTSPHPSPRFFILCSSGRGLLEWEPSILKSSFPCSRGPSPAPGSPHILRPCTFIASDPKTDGTSGRSGTGTSRSRRNRKFTLGVTADVASQSHSYFISYLLSAIDLELCTMVFLSLTLFVKPSRTFSICILVGSRVARWGSQCHTGPFNF